MKTSVVSVFFLCAWGQVMAFAPVAQRAWGTALKASPDVTSAIEAAVAAVKQFGADSQEARVAWEAVEEVSSSNENSEVSKPSLAEECQLNSEAEIDQACQEYGAKMEALSKLMQEYTPQLNTLKELASEMKNIKLSVAEAQPGADSPAIREALANAKKAEAEFGAGSPEAKMAWETLEEVASAGLETVTENRRLDEDCLVESAVDACLALEELNRALNLQKSGGGVLNS